MEQSETIKDIYRRSSEMYTSGDAAATARPGKGLPQREGKGCHLQSGSFVQCWPCCWQYASA
jgi:hypothetical protein